jgi:hypothetical protein
MLLARPTFFLHWPLHRRGAKAETPTAEDGPSIAAESSEVRAEIRTRVS